MEIIKVSNLVKDYKDVKGILASAEMLRQKCKETVVPKVGTLDFED